MCMSVLPTCISEFHVCSWCLKRGLDPLYLESETTVSHHVGARHQTWVFWELVTAESSLQHLVHILFFLINVIFVCAFVCAYANLCAPSAGACRSQKRALDPLEGELKEVAPSGCWESNPDPLWEQWPLLITESSSSHSLSQPLSLLAYTPILCPIRNSILLESLLSKMTSAYVTQSGQKIWKSEDPPASASLMHTPLSSWVLSFDSKWRDEGMVTALTPVEQSHSAARSEASSIQGAGSSRQHRGLLLIH